MPAPNFVWLPAAQTWSTLAQRDRLQSCLHTEHKKQHYDATNTCFNLNLITNKKDQEPTIEFHGDLAQFVVVHDGIGVVVRLPDHYLSVQFWASSWWRQKRAQFKQRDAALNYEKLDKERH